jgi:hypothetical protein
VVVVRWAAAQSLRSLRALPLPHILPVSLSKIILHSVPDVPGGLVPQLEITTAPYQGAKTAVLFNSAWHTPAPETYTRATHDSIMWSMKAVLRGDVLLTLRHQPANSALFRVAFHTSFMLHEGVRGVYRLTTRDLDVDHTRKHITGGVLPPDMIVDLIYTVLPPDAVAGGGAGEARARAGTGGAGSESSAPASAPARPVAVAPLSRGSAGSDRQLSAGSQGHGQVKSRQLSSASAASPMGSPLAAAAGAAAAAAGGGVNASAELPRYPNEELAGFGADNARAASVGAASPFDRAAAVVSPASSGGACSLGEPDDGGDGGSGDESSRGPSPAAALLEGAPAAAGAAELADGVACSGYLGKRGPMVRNWKRRWFVLRVQPLAAGAGGRLSSGDGSDGAAGAADAVAAPASTAVLYYYSSPHDSTPKGVVPITPAVAAAARPVTASELAEKAGGRPHCFKLSRGNNQNFYLHAKDDADLRRWLAAIAAVSSGGAAAASN